MDYVVTVAPADGGKSHKYWVEASNDEDAAARGFRLHCASENHNPAQRAVVLECKPVV